MSFDAIVIGTGFGGTIAASKLVEKGKKVLMLERGTWWISPETLGKPAAGKPMRQWLTENNQPIQYWPRPDHRNGLLDFFKSLRGALNNTGLYQYSMFDEVHILTASAVGGGSMIYSNVTLQPDPEILQNIKLSLGDSEFDQAKIWMLQYRGQLHKVVTKIPLPGRDLLNLGNEDYLYLDRSRALKDAAVPVSQKFGIPAPWAPLDLAITEYDPNPASDAAKNHTFCERQGRCILGCLPAARLTLNKTIYKSLLLDPTKGAALMPLAEARYIKPVVGGYEVHYLDHQDDGNEKTVTAPQVFLAAGTLGTTELLLRSRDQGLPLSGQLNGQFPLGGKFSTNGDFAGFVMDTAHPVYSTRGPINTSHVHLKYQGAHITVEDAAIPAMFADLASNFLQALDSGANGDFFTQLKLLTIPTDVLNLFADPDDPNRFQTEAEMVSNIFFFNVSSQDDANGVFTLDNDKLDLNWPDGQPLAAQAIFGKITTLLQAFATAMGGRYVPFPLWEGLPFLNRKVVTVHPLGGCPIGATNAEGVVNEVGQVFDGSRPAGSKNVLPGLYIVDGSVIPGALAANPTLTITAQALKTIKAALP